MQSLLVLLSLLVGMVLGALIWSLRLRSTTVSSSTYDTVAIERDGLRDEVTKLRERSDSVKVLHDQAVTSLNVMTGRYNLEAQTVARLSTELVGAKSELERVSQGLTASEERLTQQTQRLKEVEADKLKAQTQLDAASERIQRLANDLEEQKGLAESYRQSADQNSRLLHAASAENKSLMDKLDSQTKELEAMHERLTVEFTNIANAILEEKSEKFTKHNRAEIDGILTPFKEKLDDLRKRVEDTYDAESKQRFSLEGEVKRLYELNQRLSKDAENLTNALTTNTRIQGSFGQTVLERILEVSGLQRDREYFVQEHIRDVDGKPLRNEDGQRMLPDVIIKYPDDRQVIVDSKVSYVDYGRAVQAQTEEEQAGHAKALVQAIQRHIDDLSGKKYQDHAPALDFVIMFVPMESAYLLAMHTDPTLWEYAFSKRVLLSSPTNLIVALKMIVDLWRRDRQAKNYEAIVEKGGKLYDKFVSVVESFQEVGKHLKATETSYVTTMSRFKDGRGNLLRQVDQLKELGANAKKILPTDLREPDLSLASTGGTLSEVFDTEEDAASEESDVIEQEN